MQRALIFRPGRFVFQQRNFAKKMNTITTGVEFNIIAREWRMKWSGDNDKASLAACQAEINKVLPAIKQVNGVKKVQRVVCGGCLDFKIIVSLGTIFIFIITHSFTH